MMKRCFDILFSAVLLMAALPLLVLLALAIKASSRGPIFYASSRVGKNKRIIKCWKFRTMFQDAETHLQEILAKNPSFQKEWEKYCKLKADPRVTRIGRFLRCASLDELPQFWNVLRGDLSVVGPRPFLVDEVEAQARLMNGELQKILSVRPGITGIWQTSGRSLLTFKERILLDATYADRGSFFFDLKLIAKTAGLIVLRNDAY